MTRKLVLMLALFAAVGFSFGWITEDLCCLGGSYADDPNTPVVAAEYALPSHSQAAPKAALPTLTAEPVAVANVRTAASTTAPADHPSGLSSLANPRRC